LTDDEGASDEVSVEQRLAGMFDVFQHFGDADLLMLRAFWDDADGHERERAWRAALRAINDEKQNHLLDDARSRLALWVNNYDAAYGVFGGSLGGTEGVDPGTVRQAAVPPLLDAIVGTIAQSWISDDEFETLVTGFSAILASREKLLADQGKHDQQ
jgi:hypothetical protein